jgi:hypothetical protein
MSHGLMHFALHVLYRLWIMLNIAKVISFKFHWRYFPLVVSLKHVGVLTKVGIYLLQPVFSHGQHYIAISRVTSKNM